MTNRLEKKLQKLEEANKRMIAEIIEVDQLMRDIGFIDGLNSLKISAENLKKS